MNQSSRKIVRATEKAVERLVAECRKGGALYSRNPGAVAQVSRTAKWLLNATARLHRALDTASTDDAVR